jgi:hypothetical protein
VSSHSTTASVSHSKHPSSTNKCPAKAYIQSYFRRTPVPGHSVPTAAPHNLGEQIYPLIDARAENKVEKNTPSININSSSISEPQTRRLENVAPEVHSLCRPWRPTWLRRRVFFAFAVRFVTLAVIIGPLLSVSQRASEIASPKENLHYLWTFEPTAGAATCSLYGVRLLTACFPCSLQRHCSTMGPC